MKSRIRSAAVVVLAAFIGCTEADDSDPVESPDVLRQAIDEQVWLEVEETWRVGTAQSGVELFRPVGVDRTEDGTTLILDSGNYRLLQIDQTGDLVGEFGSRGEGPGEFTAPFSFAAARDTVIVNDRGSRVHFFTASGDHIETRQFDFGDPDTRMVGQVGASPTGWVASGTGYFRSSNSGGRLPPALRENYFAVAPDAEPEPLGLRYRHEPQGQYVNDIFWIDAILQHRPSGGIDKLGRFMMSDTATYRVDIYSIETGERLLRVENEISPTPLDSRIVGMWEETAVCPPQGSECSEQMFDVRRSLPRTEHRPVISRLRVFPTGHFAALRGDLDPNPFDADRPSVYDYFGPQGRYLGSTDGMIPLWFDGAELVSMQRDALGVESIAHYLVRP